jgi:hypothetical protein
MTIGQTLDFDRRKDGSTVPSHLQDPPARCTTHRAGAPAQKIQLTGGALLRY